jgi:hypothetical protein
MSTYISVMNGVRLSRRCMSPNGPNQTATMSVSTGVVCVPWRYLGVWKIRL